MERNKMDMLFSSLFSMVHNDEINLKDNGSNAYCRNFSLNNYANII